MNTIAALLDEIRAVSLEKEIILVDDFSTDGSRQFLKEKFANGLGDVKVLYHDKNRGKGDAIKTALRYATGDYAIIQDADLEYDPQEYRLLLDAAAREKADAVYGSRFKTSRKATSFWHFLVNRFLTDVTNILFRAKLTDMETCYKMIKTDVF
jgi:glycosyltransferase involved in cell wall biosynthesis